MTKRNIGQSHGLGVTGTKGNTINETRIKSFVFTEVEQMIVQHGRAQEETTGAPFFRLLSCAFKRKVHLLSKSERMVLYNAGLPNQSSETPSTNMISTSCTVCPGSTNYLLSNSQIQI